MALHSNLFVPGKVKPASHGTTLAFSALRMAALQIEPLAMTRMLRIYVGLALALSVALSSMGHATARSHAHGAQTLVICTGYGLVRIVTDADGHPVEQSLPCPDCVIQLTALFTEADTALQTLPQRSASLSTLRSLWLSAAAGYWHDTRAPPTLV